MLDDYEYDKLYDVGYDLGKKQRKRKLFHNIYKVRCAQESGVAEGNVLDYETIGLANQKIFILKEQR